MFLAIAVVFGSLFLIDILTPENEQERRSNTPINSGNQNHSIACEKSYAIYHENVRKLARHIYLKRKLRADQTADDALENYHLAETFLHTIRGSWYVSSPFYVKTKNMSFNLFDTTNDEIEKEIIELYEKSQRNSCRRRNRS